MQDIRTATPRHKGPPKTIPRKKEFIAKDRGDENLEDTPLKDLEDTKLVQVVVKEEEESSPPTPGEGPEDMPDGGQISKSFGKLCKMVKERVRSSEEPEPPVDLYPKGRYVLVSRDASYVDPGFCSVSIPARGRVVVSTEDGSLHRDHAMEPSPEQPRPPWENEWGCLQGREDGHPPSHYTAGKEDKKDTEELKDPGEKQDGQEEDEGPRRPCLVITPGPQGPSALWPQRPGASQGASERQGDRSGSLQERSPPGTLAFERVEVMESMEKFSTESIQTYEETAVIVETLIGGKTKANKKKMGDKGSHNL